MTNFKEEDKTYIANTYNRFDLQIIKGSGAILVDSNNKEYIDFNSGIAVNTFGINDSIWKDAIISQLNKVQHTSNLYYSEPDIILAKKLSQRTGCKKTFFNNSGAEANECAIKCARLWGELNKGKDYYNIITFNNGFHGRTITTLSATAQDIFHEHFYPMTDGFLYASVNDVESIKKLVKENKCCAIMTELIQGEGGVLPLEKGFVKELVNICKENNLLLIIDEVQTGNGRTGSLYCYMQYGINPDIVTTAKGLAGGLPFGATMFFDRTENILSAGLHGSTFGGNPVCSAGAISVLDRIDDKLLNEIKEKSQYVVENLTKCNGVKSATGMGFMLGIDVTCDSSKVINSCIKNGVLPIKAKNKIRLLPPLNIPFDVLKKGVKLLVESIEENI